MKTESLEGLREDLKTKTLNIANSEAEAVRKLGAKMLHDVEDLSKVALKEASSELSRFTKNMGRLMQKYPFVTAASLLTIGFVIAKVTSRSRKYS